MSFGFLVERFGLFRYVVLSQQSEPLHRSASLVIGIAFILLGVAEIPDGYWVNAPVLTNLLAMALLALV